MLQANNQLNEEKKKNKTSTEDQIIREKINKNKKVHADKVSFLLHLVIMNDQHVLDGG